MLFSIQKIKVVYNTGDLPVLVECNDLNDYVCKHNRGQRAAYKLFAEWISHALLQDLGVRVAPKTLVHIKDEHVWGTAECQIAFFRAVPSFATLHLKEVVEWNQFDIKDLKLISNVNDLLIVAFFDLWLANEDRNFNNFNLLIRATDAGFEIIPIDHGACFNSLAFNPEQPLRILCENESLIDTDEFRKLVRSRMKKLKDASDFIESLYLRIPDLEKKYDEHVLEIPSEWHIPKEYITALKANLFDKDWLDVTKTTFLSFIKTSLKIK